MKKKKNRKNRRPNDSADDWNKLTEYVIEHAACFSCFSPEDLRYNTLKEFVFCSPNSLYRPLVESFLEDKKQANSYVDMWRRCEIQD
jgi:hypothetical protein